MMTSIRSAFLITVLGATSVHSAANPPIRCLLRDPTSCPTTNYLSWSPGFEDAVTRFIGTTKVNYFRHDRALDWQALYGLGGPADDRKALPGGLFLFAACPAHDCGGQAAAIVLDAHGSIKGIGFSSFHCANRCDVDHRYLDFYVRRGPTADTVISALTEWGHGPAVQSLLQDPRVDDGLVERTTVKLVQ
jgi:hypothetical protein